VLDLGHGGIPAVLLTELDPAVRSELIECLTLKDGAELRRRAERRGVPADLTDVLLGLLDLQGGAEVFETAKPVLRATPAWPLVEELGQLYDAIVRSGISSQIVVDLGETRAAAYYTGPTFQILAEGPGQAVASGGRYDALYDLFGAGRPAAGAAIQVDHLRWALGKRPSDQRTRVVFAVAPGSSSDAKKRPDVARAAALLREAGIPCVFVSSDEALDYARAWRYSIVARPAGDGFVVVRVEENEEVDLGKVSVDEIKAKICP
jgi:ATP phosphoribosyltransferase regulatory subunit